MNPIYSIIEAPHRWLILAGLSLLVAIVGGIAMITLVWPHIIVRIWLILGLVCMAYFLIRELLQWKERVEVELEREQAIASRAKDGQ